LAIGRLDTVPKTSYRKWHQAFFLLRAGYQSLARRLYKESVDLKLHDSMFIENLLSSCWLVLARLLALPCDIRFQVQASLQYLASQWTARPFTSSLIRSSQSLTQ
jgi:hypothetical protein